MENPPFWWYFPGKIWSFHGYVSLPEGILPVPSEKNTWGLKDYDPDREFVEAPLKTSPFWEEGWPSLLGCNYGVFIN